LCVYLCTHPGQFRDFIMQMKRRFIGIHIRSRRVRMPKDGLRSTLIDPGSNTERLESFPERVKVNNSTLTVPSLDSRTL
jgi:hypothetical protein